MQTDLVRAQYQIALAHCALAELAEKKGDEKRLGKLFPFIVRYLEIEIIPRFKVLDVQSEMTNAVYQLGKTYYLWAIRLPEKGSQAIEVLTTAINDVSLGEDSDKTQELSFYLADLYRRGNMFLNACNALEGINTEAPESELLMIYFRSRALVSGEDRISEDNLNKFELHFSLLNRKAIEMAENENNYIITYRDLTIDVRELLVSIGLRLFLYYREIEDGKKALSFFRQLLQCIEGKTSLPDKFVNQIPSLLPVMWKLAGASEDEVTRDFSLIVMPLMDRLKVSSVIQLTKDLAAWEKEISKHRISFASTELGFLLADHLVGKKKFSEAKRIVSDNLQLFDDFNKLSVEKSAAMSAKFLGVLLILVRRKGPVATFQKSYDQIFEKLEAMGAYDELLVFLIDLIKSVQKTHEKTRDDWFSKRSKKIMGNLKRVQEKSNNVFSVISQLINLYLQLPGFRKDAIDLLKRQCEHLLEKDDYEELPNYLSFLSDLHYSYFEETSTRLIIEIVEKLIQTDVSFETTNRILYNTAKLLDGPEVADISAAIYAKLYQLSTKISGSDVWGILSKWESPPNGLVGLELEEKIALRLISELWI